VSWRRSFGQLGVGTSAGVGFRVVAMVAALILTVAFLAFVPARRTWFTRLGSATMYAYLLHGFVTLYLSYQDWYYGISGEQVALVTAGCACWRSCCPATRCAGASDGRWSRAWTGCSARPPHGARWPTADRTEAEPHGYARLGRPVRGRSRRLWRVEGGCYRPDRSGRPCRLRPVEVGWDLSG
jgi:hypothetical protein